MKKKLLRIAAIFVTLALLLCGCVPDSYKIDDVTPFSEMVYTRPDMDAIQRSLDSCCEAAEKGTPPEIIMAKVQVFYSLYDQFYTNYSLADIHYCIDLTDTYWEAEYDFCTEASPTVDAMLDALYCALADSPMRGQLEAEEYFGEGFFDDYEESTYDDDLVAMLEKEGQLIADYYTLTEEVQAANYEETAYAAFADEATKLYVELIKVRRETAAYLGYDSYPEYAFEALYGRDYTPAQAREYLEQLSQILYTPYVTVFPEQSTVDYINSYCSEADTFGYTRAAATAMGGTISQAFSFMQRGQLYDNTISPNKFGTAFEVYLTTYQSPFIFMNPYGDQTDKLGFAHEFGHYCNDYACGGSYVGADVAEVHSQAFEYLSLCYAKADPALTEFKLLDGLSTYMDNGAFALFELLVYDLEESELTPENVQALYEQVGIQFGFDQLDWDRRDWVEIPHFFTNGMYVISYVLSNDLAMQIYEMELHSPGKGLEVYNEILTSQDTYLMTFAETYGLLSPFSTERLEALKTLFD